MQKNIFFVVLVAILFALSSNFASAQVLDRIIAVVNGDIITLLELDDHLEQVSPGFEGAPPAAQIVARNKFLDVLINDILLRQEAERLQVEVTDTEVENEIRQLKARRQLTDAQFADSLKLQGLSLEQFKSQTRQEMMKHRILGFMVQRKVVVTQEEVDAYFEEHRAEFTSTRLVNLQMLVLSDNQAAQAIRALVEQGQLSFDEAVSTHSIGPREDNGVIKDVRWEDLAQEWQSALDLVQIGDMSQPFPVQGGWVVLKVLDFQQGPQREFADVEEDVRAALLSPKLEARFQEYMAGLRSKAVVEKRL